MEDVIFWKECKKTLERDLTLEEYTTWIAPLLLKENQGSVPPSYTLIAPNKFILDWVEDNYGNSIETRLLALSNSNKLNLTYEVNGDNINIIGVPSNNRRNNTIGCKFIS